MRPRSLLLAAAVLTVATFTLESRAEAQDYCPPGWVWSPAMSSCRKPCPAGFYFNRVTGHCTKRGRLYRRCAAGSYWNHSMRRCVRTTRCPPGFYYNYAIRSCRKLKQNCSYGWRWDAYRNTCVQRCPLTWRWNGVRCVKPAQRCGPGWRWSAYYSRCVRLASQTCPNGMSWNGYRCVSWRRCPPGHYWSSHRSRCMPKMKTCPHGYRYRPGWGCQQICAAGWYFSAGRCIKSVSACPQNKFWSQALRRCVNRCGAGSYWSYRLRRCKPLTW